MPARRPLAVKPGDRIIRGKGRRESGECIMGNAVKGGISIAAAG